MNKRKNTIKNSKINAEQTQAFENHGKPDLELNTVQAALREATVQLQLIFQNMINALVIWESVFDEHGRFVSFRFGYFNDAYAHISKLNLDDVQGKDVFEVWPGTEESWIEIYREVAMTGLPKTFDMYHKPTNGFYHCNAYRPGATPEYVCVILEDITERNRAAEVLKESERKYRALVETTDTGYVILDQSGNVLDANREYVRLAGYQDLDEIKGKNVTEWTARYDVEKNADAVMKCFEQGFIRDLRIDYTDKTGRSTPIEINATVIETGTGPQIVTLCRDITERKRAEEILFESEAKYRAVVESSLIAVYIVQDSLFRFVNKRWCEIYGFTYGEIVDKVNPLDLTSPEDKKLVEENFRKRLSGEVERIESEVRAIRKNGDVITLKVLGSFMLYKGHPAIAGTAIDITEHKRAEEALCTSQAQLSEAMDIAHIVYWESDPLTAAFIFNDPFYALYGTTAKQEGGYRMTQEEYSKRFVYPDDLSRFLLFAEQNTLRPDQEFVAEIEHRIIRRDGEVRHILGRTRIVRDDSGRIIKRYGANQDITERKETEKALQESEERFRKMFEGSPIGMVMTDANAHFIRVNAAFCQMLGYTEEELASMTFKTITHPDHIAEDMLHVNDLISGKIDLYQTEKRYIRKDKGTAWGSTRVNIVRDRNGRFFYCLTMIENITQRKQSEEERIRLESQLFQAQKMEAIGTLAAGIAHDFNNILTALVGYAALLKMKIKSATSHTYVDHILSASYKAADLIQNLLAFSKQQTISLKPISLHHVIKGTEKLLKRLVTEDIAIKTLLTAEDIIIMADATQIDQILFNLATNARDSMPQGGTFTIETKAVELGDEFHRIHGYSEPGRYALLSISDTGIGMDEKTQEKIFDPFFTTKEVGKGTGLGLSTVYGIVKQHNGYITVYSEPCVGTVFHIYLPVANKTGEGENLVKPPLKGGNETILIAEDNEAVRSLISTVLIEYGYRTIEAVDGEDAIEQFKKNSDKIDLLIFDSIMPKKNGREAYDEIKNIKPDIRIIFTSGYTRDVFLDKGIEDKKFHFLQKPISPNALLQMARDTLDERQ